MAFIGGFDASKVAPNEFAPIPAGKYLAAMVESEFKPNKAKTGEYLECKFQVVDGQHKGRKLISRLNLKHPNEQAASIAQGDLSAICRAVGVLTPNDSTDLHNVPIELVVGVTNPDEQGRVFNEIKGYAKRGAAEAASVAAAAAPAGVPAWMQKKA